MDAAPSMVHRSGDSLIIRSVVSGHQLYISDNNNDSDNNSKLDGTNALTISDNNNSISTLKHYTLDNFDQNSFSGGGGGGTVGLGVATTPATNVDDENLRKSSEKDEGLPQCKIKRNYSCSNCTFFTQNPRHYLIHLRDKHGEKINIYECKLCLYASRHYQKLVRHMKMVHGSTEGLEESGSGRKRSINMNKCGKRQRKSLHNHVDHQARVSLPPIPDMPNEITLSTIVPPPATSVLPALSLPPNPPVVYPPPLLKQALEMPLTQDKKPYKCAICEFVTLNRNALLDHEKNDHIKTRFFRCVKCNYVTHIKARYSKHVKYHSMPMIKCMMCDFRTPYKWNLDRHMKNHGGAGPFKCSACNFTADIKQSLTVHEMNHHVPPVGHVTSMVRRKLKVGGTDLGDDMNGGDSGNERHEVTWPFFPPMSSNSDDIIHSNENSDLSDSYNAPPTPNDLDDSIKSPKSDIDAMSEAGSINDPSSHSQPPPAKKAKRPIPNLIPINFSTFNNNNNNSALNLSVRKDKTPKHRQDEEHLHHQLLEKVALENVYQQLSDSDMHSSFLLKHSSGGRPKANVSFFDKLKEKLVTELADPNKLICRCGHVSKCLSESILHKKSCEGRMDSLDRDHLISMTANTGSTRCQFCRHRCKSSADLMIHTQTCVEAQINAEEASAKNDDGLDDDEEEDDDESIDDEVDASHNEPHPMENVVFVWNKILGNEKNFEKTDKTPEDDIKTEYDAKEADESLEDVPPKDAPADINQYFAIETAPGYGEITKDVKYPDEIKNFSLKRVFKCPQCPFWASTASRFHVHIVGHLNQKPFECSLCAYRSNWRWDITKHIRLKTIRDPNHEKAKVLMNDETGRRNYTKYNKYITLVKVTAENTDTKFLKSGDILMNHDMADHHSSFSENESKNNSASTSPMLPLGLQSLHNQHHHEINNLGGTYEPSGAGGERGSNISDSNVMGINLSTETHSDNSENGEGMEGGNGLGASADTKKTTNFKCKKCNFRHSSREVVLAHVKQHYRDAGIPIDDITTDTSSQATPPMDTVAATNQHKANIFNQIMMSLPDTISFHHHQQPQPQHHQQQDQIQDLSVHTKTTASDNEQITLKPLPVSASTVPSSISQNPDTVMPSAQTSTTPVHTANDHGEMDEASSGVTSVSGWRCPAPYRCGHCHQVSNWKHVIQRHCRLKHRGDIRIELFDKISLKNNKNAFPNYQPLNPNSLPHHNIGRSSNSYTSASSSPSSSSQQQRPPSSANIWPLKTPNEETAAYEVGSNHDDKDEGDEEEHFSQEEQTTMESSNFKKYKCDECPYFTDSKYQFMYHESFHKPRDKSPYQCSYCSYNVSKRHLLSQHVKIHENGNGGGEGGGQYNSAATVSHRKELMFCQKCPARYTVDKDLQLHTKMHSKKFPYRCFLCTYTTRHESHLKNHLNVHSQQYSDKTKEMESSYKLSQAYRKPNMTSTTHPGVVVDSSKSNQIFWIVDAAAAAATATVDLMPNAIAADDNKVPELSLRGGGGGVKALEKCPHCPFVTPRADILKNHLQFHKCISGYERDYQCQHCDFSINDFNLFNSHNSLHFTSLQNLLNGSNGGFGKSCNGVESGGSFSSSNNNNNSFSDNNNVAFYTSFKDLEINLIKFSSKNNLNSNPVSTTELVYKEDDCSNNNNNNNNNKTNSNSNNVSSSHNNSSDERKIILNISNTSDIMG